MQHGMDPYVLLVCVSINDGVGAMLHGYTQHSNGDASCITLCDTRLQTQDTFHASIKSTEVQTLGAL